MINSLYDPLGITVVIQGKGLLRSMSSHLNERHLEDWDKPLPEDLNQHGMSGVHPSPSWNAVKYHEHTHPQDPYR